MIVEKINMPARDNEPRSEIDFAPLSVEYQERFSSAGMTSGGFKKREVSCIIYLLLVSVSVYMLHTFYANTYIFPPRLHLMLGCACRT